MHCATAYTSLVRPKLEYCGAIWDPTAKRSIDIMERVQRQSVHSALMQYGAASVTELLKDLHWAELVDRHPDQCLTLFFKLVNSYIMVSPSEIDIVRAQRPVRLPLNQYNLR